MRHFRFGWAIAALIGPLAFAQAEKSVDVVVGVPRSGGVVAVLKTVVRFGDLDVSTASGAAALLERINTAATTICTARREKEVPRLPAERYERCQKDGVAVAVKRLGEPEVTRAFGQQ